MRIKLVRNTTWQSSVVDHTRRHRPNDAAFDCLGGVLVCDIVCRCRRWGYYQKNGIWKDTRYRDVTSSSVLWNPIRSSRWKVFVILWFVCVFLKSFQQSFIHITTLASAQNSLFMLTCRMRRDRSRVLSAANTDAPCRRHTTQMQHPATLA